MSELGIFVPISFKQGTWSEIGFERAVTEVVGYEIVHDSEVKNQSSFSRRGSYCILLQVYLLPFRGNSINPRLIIASLNRSMSFISPPALFLSSGHRTRLNPPLLSSYYHQAYQCSKTTPGNLLFFSLAGPINIGKKPVFSGYFACKF